MNKDELLKAIMKLQRFNLNCDSELSEYAYMESYSIGDYVQYEDLIDLINKLYEQSK